MPSFPEMPDFPEISSPTVGSSFYHPQISAAKTYTNEDESKKKDTSAQNDTTVLTNTDNQSAILNSLLSSSSGLTTNDISSLYDSGLFSNLNSLTNNLSSSNTDVILQRILTSLDELKSEQKKLSSVHNQNEEDKNTDSKTFVQRSPAVLRLKINGYDLMNTLERTFFSESENDGSFLFTADRKYYVNNKTFTETFYILFKTKKATGSSTEYDVEISLNQDTKNENSYIYKLAGMKNLSATKTGNLLVMNCVENKNKVDMLLDIDLKQD